MSKKNIKSRNFFNTTLIIAILMAILLVVTKIIFLPLFDGLSYMKEVISIMDTIPNYPNSYNVRIYSESEAYCEMCYFSPKNEKDFSTDDTSENVYKYYDKYFIENGWNISWHKNLEAVPYVQYTKQINNNTYSITIINAGRNFLIRFKLK